MYTEAAMAAEDNMGRSCSHCREIQKKPCSFVQERRASDSGGFHAVCDPSVGDFVLRSELDAALARIDKMQADIRRLESRS